MPKIGLFCGTFNPIHIGHLIIAECARAQFNLDKVLFVTSPNPPHRNEDLLDAESRHELVEAAVDENPAFEACRMELERKGPSYTVDTVKQVRTAYGEVEIYLIIGGDNLSQLKTWKDIDELVKLCHIAVVPRLRYLEESDPALRAVGNESTDMDAAGLSDDAQITIVDFPGIAVSGSIVRKRIREGKTVLYMVPPAVDAIIKKRAYFKVGSHK